MNKLITIIIGLGSWQMGRDYLDDSITENPPEY